jgi:hypothetical protein
MKFDIEILIKIYQNFLILVKRRQEIKAPLQELFNTLLSTCPYYVTSKLLKTNRNERYTK